MENNSLATLKKKKKFSFSFLVYSRIQVTITLGAQIIIIMFTINKFLLIRVIYIKE